jgi:hypothetical protein
MLLYDGFVIDECTGTEVAVVVDVVVEGLSDEVLEAGVGKWALTGSVEADLRRSEDDAGLRHSLGSLRHISYPT